MVFFTFFVLSMPRAFFLGTRAFKPKKFHVFTFQTFSLAIKKVIIAAKTEIIVPYGVKEQ